jgi:hypothetical protein
LVLAQRDRDIERLDAHHLGDVTDRVRPVSRQTLHNFTCRAHFGAGAAMANGKESRALRFCACTNEKRLVGLHYQRTSSLVSMRRLPNFHERRPTDSRRWATAALLLALFGSSPAARAQDVIGAVTTPPKHVTDAGLVLALPAALQTGLSAGIGAGYLRALTEGGRVLVGARASWSTATEHTLTDTVRNDDLRLRACLALQQVVGRGSFGLRLGVGATAVYEDITVSQAGRIGAGGDASASSKWYWLPAADLGGVVFLRVWHGWGMSLDGGPTLHLRDGATRWGWSSGLGVLWQP